MCNTNGKQTPQYKKNYYKSLRNGLYEKSVLGTVPDTEICPTDPHFLFNFTKIKNVKTSSTANMGAPRHFDGIINWYNICKKAIGHHLPNTLQRVH